MPTRTSFALLALLAASVGCHEDHTGTVGPVCPDTTAVLERGPVAIEDLAFVAPIASLVPPDHTFPTPHMYFYMVDGEPSTPDHDDVPLVAPATLYVTSISVRAYDAFQGTPDVRDYDIDFSVCRDVTGYFIHVRSITHPALLAALDEAIAARRCDLDVPGTTLPGAFVNQRACTMTLREPIVVDSGARIGTAGHAAIGIGGVDLGMRDYRVPDGRSAFANPDRWCSASTRDARSRCFAVSPLALMPDAVAAPYEALVSDGFGYHRTEPPLAGNSLLLDVVGTARGYWFALPEVDPRAPEGPEYAHLYFGPDPIAPSLDALSLGARFESAPVSLAAGTYVFTPTTSGTVNRGAADVTPGETFCYERLAGSARALAADQLEALGGKVLVLSLAPDGMRLDVDVQDRALCGAGPYTLSANALSFVR